MLATTNGIIFRVIKYRETSIITNIYTEEYGLSSYIVNNVRSAKSKFNIGYFEPLNLVQITAYHRQNRDLNRITEIKTTYPLHSIRQDTSKSAITIFLTEVLNKCIVEHDKNERLFSFICSSIKVLELQERNNSFHLQFMFKLATFLGFGISDTSTFTDETIDSKYYQDKEIQNYVQHLILGEISESISIPPIVRRVILNDLIHFYQNQIGMPKPKSLEVLNTVLS